MPRFMALMNAETGGRTTHGSWRAAYRATEPRPMDVPPCVINYAEDPGDVLEGLIRGLQEELASIPRHRFNVQKVADRERGLAIYQRQLSRLDQVDARQSGKR